jgi:hypothetical protein
VCRQFVIDPAQVKNGCNLPHKVIARHHRIEVERIEQLTLVPIAPAPSWPVPAAVHPIGMESLFASIGNRLLQQNQPEADLILPVSYIRDSITASNWPAPISR